MERCLGSVKWDRSSDMRGEVIRTRLALFCFVSMAGLYLSIYSHQISLLVFIFNFLSIFFLNTTELYCELFFLFPYTMIYKYSTGSTSLFTYLTLIFMVVFLARNKFLIKKDFLFCWALLAVYMVVGVGSNITDYIKLLNMAVIVSLFTSLIKRENYHDIVLYVCFGTVTSALIGMRKSSWPALASFFSNLKTEHINGVRVYRFTGLYMDPNYFSILLITCLVSLLAFTFKKEIKSGLAIFLSIALVFFGCLTYSRLFYLSLIIALFIVLILRIKTTGKLLGSIGVLLLALAAGIFFVAKTGILSNILFRFNLNDISNNRFNIWGQYLSYFNSSVKTFLFGDGIGASYYNRMGPHNTYIEMVYFLGVIGSTIYISMYWCILRKGRRGVQRRLLNYSLLFVLMIMAATLGMLFSNDFGFLMMLVIILMNTNLSSIPSFRTLKEQNAHI